MIGDVVGDVVAGRHSPSCGRGRLWAAQSVGSAHITQRQVSLGVGNRLLAQGGGRQFGSARGLVPLRSGGLRCRLSVGCRRRARTVAQQSQAGPREHPTRLAGEIELVWRIGNSRHGEGETLGRFFVVVFEWLMFRFGCDFCFGFGRRVGAKARVRKKCSSVKSSGTAINLLAKVNIAHPTAVLVFSLPLFDSCSVFVVAPPREQKVLSLTSTESERKKRLSVGNKLPFHLFKSFARFASANRADDDESPLRMHRGQVANFDNR